MKKFPQYDDVGGFPLPENIGKERFEQFYWTVYKAIVNTGKYLGHFHTSENNRGIPGTGLVDWMNVYRALRDINYSGWLVIESFYIGFGNVWKLLANTPEQLIAQGLNNLKYIEEKVTNEN